VIWVPLEKTWVPPETTVELLDELPPDTIVMLLDEDSPDDHSV
jgi:hypothetical protein